MSGAFMVLGATDIIEVGVGEPAHRFARRGVVAVSALMLLFAAIVTAIGTQGSLLVSLPILVPLMIALKVDSVTAAGVALAPAAGFCTRVAIP